MAIMAAWPAPGDRERQMVDATLQQQLAAYRLRWPEEAALAEQFVQLLDDATDPL